MLIEQLFKSLGLVRFYVFKILPSTNGKNVVYNF